jgi:EAL domain-containing protein (putative c-di-GMP-specific phosphodiesterase class I)
VEPNAAAIINSITHLAKGLGLNVVAEGVETDAQCQALRLVGCSHLQGFLFAAAEELPQANVRYAGRGELKASVAPLALLTSRSLAG